MIDRLIDIGRTLVKVMDDVVCAAFNENGERKIERAQYDSAMPYGTRPDCIPSTAGFTKAPFTKSPGDIEDG